jgi:hypothetical protein
MTANTTDEFPTSANDVSAPAGQMGREIFIQARPCLAMLPEVITTKVG